MPFLIVFNSSLSGVSLRKRGPQKVTYAAISDSEHEELFDGPISDSDEEWNSNTGQSYNTQENLSDHSSNISSDTEVDGHVELADEASHSSSNDSSVQITEDVVPDSIERGSGDHDIGPEEPEKITKRKVKAANKAHRNSGKAYISLKGRSVPDRERRQVHACVRRKCHLVIDDDVADTLFTEYWNQGSYNKRVAYVSSRTDYSATERTRKRNQDSRKSKSVSYKYFFEVEGVRHQVCKDTFLNVLGETDAFLRRCASKKQSSVSGITRDDTRGRARPKHALPIATKEAILKHIKSFPAYVSHYCRSQTKQKYLASTLNVQKMYNLFVSENPTLKASYISYYRIFSQQKLKFKSPATDTCGNCDEYVVKLRAAPTEEEKNSIQKNYDLHLRRAEAAYNLKKKVKALLETDDTTRVLVFDLQQVLTTPLVPTGRAFYLRQLNTYNLTIVDCKTDKTHCYMWHECEAARGANEIASCLFAHIMQEVPETVKKVYLFSDCCSGQNRNSIISAMHHVLLQVHASLQSIEHIFLVPGHTRLECDSRHSVIEASKKNATIIAVPSEWYSLVRNCGKVPGSFQVTEMRDLFFDFQSLLSPTGPFVKRDKKENGEKMYWTKTHSFLYVNTQPGIVKVKESFNIDASRDCYDMIRGNGKNRRLPPRWFLSIPKSNPVKPISVQKKEDLLSLLNFIDPIHHSFYENLKTDPGIVQDTDPDLPEEICDD